MLLTYQVKDGAMKTMRIKPMSRGPSITIGRGTDADITVDDAKASRINTAIRYWDDIFIIRDMRSRNGTYLNGDKVDVARLNPGDVIKVGDVEIHTSAEDGSKTDTTISA